MSTPNSLPLVSIGLPVFNGQKTIERAIKSLLSQSYQNYEVIISDNFSSDNTEQICRAYVQNDSRVKYFRQTQNIGPIGNYQFVLEKSQGKYFMWAACDDVRSDDYIEHNVKFLESHPDYCTSTSRARDEGGQFDSRWMGDHALDNPSYETRILTFFRGWHRASIFYSLYRRDVIANNKYLYGPDFLAQDWVMIMETAKFGRMQRLEQGELVLGKGGMSKGVQHIRNSRERPIEYFFPHWQLSMYLKDISKDFSLRGRLTLLFRALLLNFRANLMRLVYIWDRR